MTIIDTKLKDWATPKQSQYIDAVNEYGGYNKAARALNVDGATISRALQAVRKKAAISGYSPEHDMTHAQPEPFSVRGVSTLYNRDGEITAQWVKTKTDEQARIEAMLEVVDDRIAEISPIKKVSAPKKTAEDLCNLYTITDYHLGMMAWGKETGEPWDLKIAKRCLVSCYSAMLDQSPNAKVGIVNQLGDFLHADGNEPLTPASKHLLDVDARFAKVSRLGLELLEWVVTETLKKHEEVYVVIAEGNHDPVSSIWIRHYLRRIFQGNPRVKIDDSELPFYSYKHGETMLAFHHGHKVKMDNLPLMFATREPKVWGTTKYRYAHTGHMHHKDHRIKEHSGMEIRQHPTLAAADAYSARGGWDAHRRVEAITYHARYGQVGSVTVTPEMVMG